MESSITGAGTLSREFFISLFKKESIEQMLKDNGFVEYSLLKGPIASFRETNNLYAIENAFDRSYYSHMMQFSSRIISKQGNLFKNFLMKEVEVLNLLTIFRLKKEGMKPEAIKGFLIAENDPKILKLADAKDFDELARLLSKTEYGEVAAKGVEEFKKTNSLIPFETEIYKILLKKTTHFAHQNLLSVDVILSYMFARTWKSGT